MSCKKQRYNFVFQVSFILDSLDLSQLEHLVIDEADSLLDQSFSELVLRILGQVQVSPIYLYRT